MKRFARRWPLWAAPPEALLRYISHGAGRAVTAVLEGTRGELNFFAFR